MSDDPKPPRSGGLVPSQGIEWSFIWLAVGILGMVLLFFTFIGTKSSDKEPSYDRESPLNPRPQREDPRDQPELGAPEGTEST